MSDYFNNDNRICKVLQILEHKRSASLEYLEKKLNVSTKSIKNDIKELNEIFDGNALIQFKLGKYKLYVLEYKQFEKIKENFNIKNTSFLCENWHDINVKKTNLYRNFDLVFASMTPAVASASTFEKFMECSRKYCVLRCNIKRNDFIYDGIRKELSMEQTKENLNFLYAFKMIYLKGYLPKIFYEEKKWIYEEPLDKAFNVYIKKIKSLKSVDMKEENQIRELINKISKDGYVKEEISSVIATIIWTVK